MSRYRVVHCLVWNDDKFPFVSDDCQLVFFHVLTTPLSSPFGLYKASIEMLASEKRWSVPRYSKAFREGLSKGFWKHDEKAMVLLIPNFLKYNPPGNPNILNSWARTYCELPECNIKTEFYFILKGFLEGFGEGFRKAFEKGFGKDTPVMRVTVTVPDTDLKEGVQGEIDEQPLELPSWLPKNEWDEFCTSRKRKTRSAITDKIARRIIGVLGQLRDLGHDPAAVLTKAVDRNWTSIEVEWIHKNGNGNAVQTSGDLSERTTRILLRGLEGEEREQMLRSLGQRGQVL